MTTPATPHAIITGYLSRLDVTFPRSSATAILQALRRQGYRIAGDEMGTTPLEEFSHPRPDVGHLKVDPDKDSVWVDEAVWADAAEDEDDLDVDLEATSRAFQAVGYIIGTAQAAISQGIRTAYAEAAMADMYVDDEESD